MARKVTSSKTEAEEDGTLTEKLSAFLAGWEEVRFAYLFGSRAFGYHRPDSDLDLAVFWEDGVSSWAEIELQEQLARHVGIPVQAISLSEGLRPRFLGSILSHGVVVKDSVERSEWERKARQIIQKEAGVQTADYKAQLLDSMKEMADNILWATPLLDQVDLEKVGQDDPEAIRDFIGVFLMLFEPVETIARKVSAYAHLALGIHPAPEGLRQQMRTMVDVLGLDEEVLEQLGKLAELRNRIVHAYWHLTEQDLEQLDLDRVRQVLDRLVSKLSLFIIGQRGAVGQG